jgi:signal transduction histidine kinase
MQELVEQQKPLLGSANIEIRADVQCEKGYFDPVRMRRALLNLLTNAKDAMPQGGILTLRARKEASYLVLEVEDTGKGIPPETQRRLFQAFYSQGKENGIGLGTLIVKTIVEAHGGHVQVQSEVGKGTRFRLYLPFAPRSGETFLFPAPPQQNDDVGSPTLSEAGTISFASPGPRKRGVNGHAFQSQKISLSL